MTWIHWIVSGVGLALMASPAVVGYGGSAATSSWIVGPLAASVGFLAVFEITRGVRFAELPLGAWLIAAPLVPGVPVDALAVSIAAGAVLVVSAFAGGERTRRYGGGWRSLLD